MFFGKRYKHKLPKFPDNVEAVFHSLCEALPAETLPDLRRELDQAVEKMHEMSRSSDVLNPQTIDELKNVSITLLDCYQTLKEQEKALAIGAIRYFVIIDDPIPDDAFSSGLYDDAMVMNYVLERIGIEDMYINV